VSFGLTKGQGAKPPADAGRWGFVVAFIVLAMLFVAVRSSSWQGSKDIHTLMETTSTLLAGVVGILALLRFHARRDIVVLLIGTGFFGTAMLDGYHTVVTSQWFDPLLPSPPPHFIPWSWNAARTFLSGMMLLSWWVWRNDPFERGIDLSLIIAVMSQAVFMPLSFGLFDVMFDTANVQS
jgi:hypothetical protein